MRAAVAILALGALAVASVAPHGDHEGRTASVESVAVFLQTLGYKNKNPDSKLTGCKPVDNLINKAVHESTTISSEALEKLLKEVFKINPGEGCEDDDTPKDDAGLRWICAMSAITALTLLAGVGMFFVPLLDRSPRLKSFVMVSLTGMAIGALLGEALLHLVPDSMMHATRLSLVHDHHPLHLVPPTITAIFVLSGVAVFYLADHAMSFFSLGCNHDHHNSHAPADTTAPGSVALRHCPEMADGVRYGEVSNLRRDASLYEAPNPTRCRDHESHGGSPAKKKKFNLRGILPIGWLILVGDALHNFMDGVTIGISFSASFLTGGYVTLAVVLHELPHELADYGILLLAGIPKGRAALLNMASNLTAFLGAALGLSLRSILKEGTWSMWACAFTAGGFIYVALADLVPLLIKMEAAPSPPTSDSPHSSPTQSPHGGPRAHKKRDYWLLLAKLLSTIVGVVIILLLLMFCHHHHH